jgi:hypothetical protein
MGEQTDSKQVEPPLSSADLISKEQDIPEHRLLAPLPPDKD